MDLFDLLEAMVKLGIPLFLFSWLLFTKLYDGGEINRDGNNQQFKQQLKAFNKSSKKKAKRSERTPVDRVMGHWVSFGGGFYGLAALWTFVVIEIKDIFSFVFYFPGLDVLFEDGLVRLAVSILVNQITNAISAVVWFSYWPAQSILIWVLVAYFGYWLGMDLAKKGVAIPIEKWLQSTKAWFD
jgi:hypothetical protein